MLCASLDLWNPRKRKATRKQKDSRSERHRYISVRDSRNRKIRGLWQRNDAYYVQFWVTGERSPRRSRLEAKTLEAAKREMASVLQKRHDGDLPTRGHKRSFDEYAREYIAFLRTATEQQRRPGTFHKSPATVHKREREPGALDRTPWPRADRPACPISGCVLR